MINVDGKTFMSVENTTDGEVSSHTYFDYHQEGTVVYAEYAGGEIVKGRLIGIVHVDDTLEFRYNHVNTAGEIRGGQCTSTPRFNEQGKLELQEKWQWMDRENIKGESLIREV